MTCYEVASLLRDYRQTKQVARDLRSEMLRLTVGELGIDRKNAEHINLETFLEGDLAGQEKTESCQTMIVRSRIRIRPLRPTRRRCCLAATRKASPDYF